MLDYAWILDVNYNGKGWSLLGNDYSGLNWFDESPKPTQAELEALWPATQEAVAKRNCKDQAKELIAKTDWAVLPDVGITNAAEFVSYRAELRDLILVPVQNPVWPIEPQPNWS